MDIKKLGKRAVKRITKNTVDRLATRQALKATIDSKAEGGMVAVIESGIDCDGVTGGSVWSVAASAMAVEMVYQRIINSAEGMTTIEIVSPSEAAGIEFQTRDLALEAFEEGRQHCIYA